MIPISKIVHGLELLINDSDTSLVCSNRNIFDVLCGLALLFQLGVDVFSGFDGGLRMELGCQDP